MEYLRALKCEGSFQGLRENRRLKWIVKSRKKSKIKCLHAKNLQSAFQGKKHPRYSTKLDNSILKN